MASPTPNKGYTYAAHGGSVNAWDYPLNYDFDTIDANLGGYYAVTILSTATTATYNSTYATISSTVATVTLPLTAPSTAYAPIASNLFYYLSGALTQNLTITFPAVGAVYALKNAATGAFTVTAKSVAGGTGATVPSDTAAILVANSSEVYTLGTGNKAKLYTYLGDPNTHVAGTAGAANGDLTDAVYDGTNEQLYSCTTTGVSSAAVWSPLISRLTPQGYLTVKNDTDFPVVTANTAGATTLYYTPYVGNWTVLSNGTVLYPYQFSRFTLPCTGMTANAIYDIFMYANPTAGIIAPVIGFGPAWTTATAGSGARGTGAGTTQLSRFQGVLTNTVQVTLTNNGVGYTCPANQGIYLGSVYVDAAGAALTCNVGAGVLRRWAVWNAYNRVPITMIAQDPNASWTTTSAAWHRSNSTSDNSVGSFTGLPEEIVTATFNEKAQTTGNNPALSIGIGINSNTTTSGLVGSFNEGGSGPTLGLGLTASAQVNKVIGLNTIQCLEVNVDAATTGTFYGAEYFQLLVQYNG